MKAVTGPSKRWSNGSKADFDRLVPIAYDELRRIAHSYMRHERVGHTLQTTALVHETYLRLLAQKPHDCASHVRFLAMVARLMRQILVEHARGHNAKKRGGGWVRIPIEAVEASHPDRDPDILVLDEALGRLSAIDPRKGLAIELRYIVGLCAEDIGDLLHVSPATVRRDLRLGKAWLGREIQLLTEIEESIFPRFREQELSWAAGGSQDAP
jgi:RNA polymerase sigma factor (TIGR02999 family)